MVHRPLPPNRIILSLLLPAAYAIVVRGSEYDVAPEMLDDIVAISVSTFDGRDRRHKRGRKAEDDEDDAF